MVAPARRRGWRGATGRVRATTPHARRRRSPPRTGGGARAGQASATGGGHPRFAGRSYRRARGRHATPRWVRHGALRRRDRQLISCSLRYSSMTIRHRHIAGCISCIAISMPAAVERLRGLPQPCLPGVSHRWRPFPRRRAAGPRGTGLQKIATRFAQARSAGKRGRDRQGRRPGPIALEPARPVPARGPARDAGPSTRSWRACSLHTWLSRRARAIVAARPHPIWRTT